MNKKFLRIVTVVICGGLSVSAFLIKSDVKAQNCDTRTQDINKYALITNPGTQEVQHGSKAMFILERPNYGIEGVRAKCSFTTKPIANENSFMSFFSKGYTPKSGPREGTRIGTTTGPIMLEGCAPSSIDGSNGYIGFKNLSSDLNEKIYVTCTNDI